MQTVINYLHTFAQVLVYLFLFAIFVRAAASWFVRDNHSRVMGFLLDVTSWGPSAGSCLRLSASTSRR